MAVLEEEVLELRQYQVVVLFFSCVGISLPRCKVVVTPNLDTLLVLTTS